MARPKYQLTDELINKMCAHIRKGTFPHVAAELEGIPPEELERWMRIGRKTKCRPVFKNLVRQIRIANAFARFTAESAMLTDNPKDWLMSGPGKETKDLPGWTRPPTPKKIQINQEKAINVGHPAIAGVVQMILEALQDLPEARTRVASILSSEMPNDVKMIEQLPQNDGITTE